ncbi:MAG TPA: hypothetical protein VH141_12370 [Pseudonocardia sp.]|nr:hypothetical protein [Pseudonocardia sp.]
MTERGCAGHENLADELREYAGGALDLLEPLVDRIREQVPDESAPEPVVCASCPVCALITVLRGGRSELAVRLAEHAAGLLAVLRAALEEGIGAPPTHPGTRPEASDRSEASAPPHPSAAQPRPAAEAQPAARPQPEVRPQPGVRPPTTAARPHPASQPHHAPVPPRHRPAGRGGGRSGRLVQHIEVSRDGRAVSSAAPPPEPC